MIKKKKRCYAKKKKRSMCRKGSVYKVLLGLSVYSLLLSENKKKGAKEKRKIKDLFNVPFEVASKHLLWLKMQKLFVDTVACQSQSILIDAFSNNNNKICLPFFFLLPSKNILIDEGWRPILKSRVNLSLLHQVTTGSNNEKMRGHNCMQKLLPYLLSLLGVNVWFEMSWTDFANSIFARLPTPSLIKCQQI